MPPVWMHVCMHSVLGSGAAVRGVSPCQRGPQASLRVQRHNIMFCMWMHVCIYACILYVWMFAGLCMFVCMHVFCMHVCMHACSLCAYMSARMHSGCMFVSILNVCMHSVCMQSVSMLVCVYLCMHSVSRVCFLTTQPVSTQPVF